MRARAIKGACARAAHAMELTPAELASQRAWAPLWERRGAGAAPPGVLERDVPEGEFLVVHAWGTRGMPPRAARALGGHAARALASRRGVLRVSKATPWALETILRLSVALAEAARRAGRARVLPPRLDPRVPLWAQVPPWALAYADARLRARAARHAALLVDPRDLAEAVQRDLDALAETALGLDAEGAWFWFVVRELARSRWGVIRIA